ncbi:Golgi membrane protein 1 isoform X1 [Fopius arisanus]|uniref:Golgi membrane protein 1 isoform X1 n=1 Tax=Fopius arisanus TaxID=64838 RepID=A0A9R1TFH1_9HYME|nr:PREDICTED: Golgi membrane protein 1-like isoform X1 [Fopius arisanus]XP_011308406.1 PREDICTED: Golgi membrane protein 1-like isoform X1 [Fopius arisanus]
MAFDSMRGLRGPPAGVVCLGVICIILTWTWWAQSTDITELYNQVDRLQGEIKVSLEEREKCETSISNLEARYKQSQDTIASLHVRENQLRKKNEELTNSAAFCNSELESVRQLDSTKDAALTALRLDKDTIDDQLNVKREEAQKLQADLEKVKIELNNLNRTCSSGKSAVAREQERNNSKEFANNLERLVDDNNADTAGEIDGDDEPSVVMESKRQSEAPAVHDSVLNHILQNSLVTPKSSKQ